jgi:hypothetical protein
LNIGIIRQRTGTRAGATAVAANVMHPGNKKGNGMITRRIAQLAAIGIFALALHLQAGDMVPFKGMCYADFTSPPIVTVTGNGTHLGLFTGELKLGATGISVVLRAANGDELWADITPTAAGAIAVITGGTGRFQGAEGGWVSTWIQPPPFLVEKFEGEISRVGSRKP